MTDNDRVEVAAGCGRFEHVSAREENKVAGKMGVGKAALLAMVAAALAVTTVSVAGAGSSPTPVTAGGTRPEKPSVSGTRVVWSDYRQGRWDIWLYDSTVGQTRQLTSGIGDKMMPAISGDKVVYVKYSEATNADIWMTDLGTGTSFPITEIAGDQLNPTISGQWVAWEDYSNGYTSKIMGFDLVANAGFVVDSSSSISKKRPSASGDRIVYENYARGAADADVWTFDCLTRTKSAVSAEPVNESLPVTDGRYVAWAQVNPGTGYDIAVKDLADGSVRTVASTRAEETFPAIGNGVLYWFEVEGGTKVVRTYGLASGAKGAFTAAGTSAIAGLAAQGDSLAWLQQNRSRWQVRALFGAPVPATQSAVSLLPSGPAWQAFRFSLSPLHKDSLSPAVMYSSVRPGQRGVSAKRFSVRFSEAMDPTSINARTVRLLDSRTGAQVPARVQYSSSRRSAVVTPLSALGRGSYTLDVTPQVRDRAGNLATAGLTVSFGTGGESAAGTVPPGKVGQPTVRVMDSAGNVAFTWSRASDDVTVTGYYVKRLNVPVDLTNYSSAATLTANGRASQVITASPAAMSITASFAPDVAGNEKGKKHVFYYIVVAVDGDNMVSQAWFNCVPDPHGTYVFGKDTNTCSRCHSTHGGAASPGGALGARLPSRCYSCHGATTASTSYGAASVNNIQAQFFAYAVDGSPAGTSSPPPGASAHNNAYLRASNPDAQCDMCHATHKKPYSSNTASSYPKLLWQPSNAQTFSVSATGAAAPTTVTTTFYYNADTNSRNASGAVGPSFGQGFCGNCHGGASANETASPVGSYTLMTVAGGATAYDAAAGDHVLGASDAHGPTYLSDEARPAVPGSSVDGTLPVNPCQVCHNEHGSLSNSLLDYRRASSAGGSAVTTGLAENGGLCFECHSGGSAADGGRAAKANNTWNGRDVWTEFYSRVSNHSLPATGSAPNGVLPSGTVACYSCHNAHFVQPGAAASWDPLRLSNPFYTTTTTAMSSTTAFCLTCHGSANTAYFDYNAGTGAVAIYQRISATQFIPYTIAMPSTTSWRYFSGWWKGDFVNAGHYTNTNTKALCENCHDPHGSDFKTLMAWTRPAGATGLNAGSRNNTNTALAKEENLCLQCHGDGIVGLQATGAQNIATPLRAAYRHPVTSTVTADKHFNNETAAQLSTGTPSNRHSECYDCHNPHGARKISGSATHTVGSSAAGGALYGVAGIKFSTPGDNWTTPTANTSFTVEVVNGQSGDDEAIVCYKCHSNAFGVVAPTGQTNIAMEFNPNNQSGHSVVASATWPKTSFANVQGATRTWATPNLSLPAGWTSTSKMTCSDCHSYNAAGSAGPHGSANQYMLKYGSGATHWYTVTLANWTTAANMCNGCHTTKTSNTAHNDTSHNSYQCQGCHVKIPHGWKRPRLLGYTTDPVAYRSTGLTGIQATNYTAAGPAEANCSGGGCGQHTGATTPWP